MEWIDIILVILIVFLGIQILLRLLNGIFALFNVDIHLGRYYLRARWMYILAVIILTLSVVTYLSEHAGIGSEHWPEDVVKTQDHKNNYYRQMDDIDSMVKSAMVYSIPDTMQVGVKSNAIVRITKSLKTRTLLRGMLLNKQKKFKDTTFYVSSIVKVSLEDATGDAFTIRSLNSKTQIIDDSTYREWQWRVVPKKSGEDKELDLTVTTEIRALNGSSDTISRDIPVFEKPIFVKTNTSLAFRNFFGTNWQWLMVVIIIPIFIALRRWFIQWKNKKKNKPKAIDGFLHQKDDG